MARLEDLTRGAQVKGVRADGPVEIVDVKWFGTSAIELTFKDVQGKPGNELLYRTDEARLEVTTKGPAWSFDADGHLFRLVSEAYRIKLAYLFDPFLAVTTSLLELLPHQIRAVYGEMLPRQPLRSTARRTPSVRRSSRGRASLAVRRLPPRRPPSRHAGSCAGSTAPFPSTASAATPAASPKRSSSISPPRRTLPCASRWRSRPSCRTGRPTRPSVP